MTAAALNNKFTVLLKRKKNSCNNCVDITAGRQGRKHLRGWEGR